MINLTANNTIIGLRLEARRPALPAPLSDFGSEADLVVERQAHAVTRQDLADCRLELNEARRVAHELDQRNAADHAELVRLRALLAGAVAVIHQTTDINLEMLNRMADDDEYVVEVWT